MYNKLILGLIYDVIEDYGRIAIKNYNFKPFEEQSDEELEDFYKLVNTVIEHKDKDVFEYHFETFQQKRNNGYKHGRKHCDIELTDPLCIEWRKLSPEVKTSLGLFYKLVVKHSHVLFIIDIIQDSYNTVEYLDVPQGLEENVFGDSSTMPLENYDDKVEENVSRGTLEVVPEIPKKKSAGRPPKHRY